MLLPRHAWIARCRAVNEYFFDYCEIKCFGSIIYVVGAGVVAGSVVAGTVVGSTVGSSVKKYFEDFLFQRSLATFLPHGIGGGISPKISQNGSQSHID